MGARVITGDCLEVMPTLDAGSVDAIVCDPPYIVGGTSVGNPKAKSGTWADMMNAAYWYSAWMGECFRVLKDSGHFLCFGSWRTLPTLMKSASDCGKTVSSCVVWDKLWIGPGPQFRPRWELVVHIAMPEAQIADRSAPDVMSCKWMAGNMKTTEHPAEKPVDLVASLCRYALPGGGSVLDPFAGSGTTGVACVREGFDFTGIEMDEAYADIARQRIEHARAEAEAA